MGIKTIMRALAFASALSAVAFAQTTSDFLGTVQDPTGAAIGTAKVVSRNLDTNATKETVTDDSGRFRIALLPPGNYEVAIEKEGFRRYTQGPIVLRLNQAADLTIKLEVGGVTETVSVTSEAPIINTTNAEVGATFESKRIAEVPLAPNRNVLNLALNVAGVSQVSTGQSSFASGVNFAVNGMRLRSNNFMLDGQDSNDPSVTGQAQQINNPDIVAEFRIVTNQFSAEYGRAAGSVVNVITKSGSNDFHGTGFYFNNNNRLNSRSNQDERTFTRAPFRNETQLGGTLGGRIIRDKTFFFGSYQRWWDRRLGSGTVIQGVPTAEGRALLQPLAATRPALRAVLENLPVGAGAAGVAPETITVNGQTLSVARGVLAGAAGIKYDDTQWSSRVDHRFNDRHTLGGRFIYADSTNAGSGQATPAGLTTFVPTRTMAATAFLTSTLSPSVYNELRASYQRFASTTTASDLASERIPSIEVNSLGLAGFNADATRTAIGLAVNLPQFRRNNTYQLQDTVGIIRGSHSMKFGVDLRRQDVVSFFLPTIRGRLQYNTLQDLVDDVAQASQINAPLRGGQPLQYYKFYDYFAFAQDEWRARPNFTLTYGIRYEAPGNPIANLAAENARIVAANGNDERYRLRGIPGRDLNNWAPRIGFNYRFGKGPGALGFLTGDSGLVLRGGYARTYDFAFINLALNIGSAFPFLNSVNLPARTPNSFTALPNAVAGATIANPNALTRTRVTDDFRSPSADQFSLNVQRQLGQEWAVTVGWVGTKGNGLFQTLDGNPTVPGSGGTQRVDPTFGVIRLRANSAMSIYHSLQTSVEKRFSKGLALGAHYTWSTYIDTASEVFNPAVSGDVAVPQDSRNWRLDRGRSTYDRPHRFTTTYTYELPFFRQQQGFAGRLLGGFQLNGFLTFQSGAPFTPLNNADPGFRLSGIDGLVGNSIRPNVATSLDVSALAVEELYGVRTSLFSQVTAASPIGNAGRNIIRADGIGNLDFGILKSTRIAENHQLQIRADFFNLTNTRNFGIPDSRINSANFLNQWATNGGNRRIQVGARYVF